MEIRSKVSSAFFGFWMCEDESESLNLPPESPRGRARDSSRFQNMSRNFKEVLEMTTDTIFQMEGPMIIDLNRDSKRIEFVPRDGWQKIEETSDPQDTAGHPPSDAVSFLDELKIEEKEQDDMFSVVLPDSPSPADVDKPDLSSPQEPPLPDTASLQGESGKMSDGFLEQGRENNRSDLLSTKQRRGRHYLQATKPHSSSRSLIAYLLIWSGIFAMANPVHRKPTQNFPKDCPLQQDHCPGDPTVRKKLNDLCCRSFNQTTSYHCQEQVDSIIHACVPEVNVSPGKTVELKTDSLGEPRLTIVDCRDGYYENSQRSSTEVISPQCQLKTTCTKNGKVLLKDGGTTADNLCDCQPHYRYMGATFTECRQGFGLDSPCACESCAAGKIRNEKNSCVQAGPPEPASTSSQGKMTSHSPVNVTEPTRGNVSVGPKMKEERPEERKGRSLTFRVVPEGIIISYVLTGIVLYFVLCRFEGPRNMLRLANGLKL